MASYDLNAQKRSTTGKSAARLLRTAGKVPAVAYGRKEAPVSLTVGAKDVWDMMAHHHSHGLLSLKFEEGASTSAFGCMRERTHYMPGAVVNAAEPWSPGAMP